jgi:hypothetical protein
VVTRFSATGESLDDASIRHYPSRMRTRARLTTAALIVLIACVRADAQQIVFDSFDASLDDGSLAGTTFSASFSYDADQVASEGDSYVTLESLDFELLGVPFTRGDIFQGGQVIFRDGVLNNVMASFQVRLPDGSPVNNITFGFGGPGIIGYIDLDGQYGTGSFVFASATARRNQRIHSSG